MSSRALGVVRKMMELLKECGRVTKGLPIVGSIFLPLFDQIDLDGASNKLVNRFLWLKLMKIEMDVNIECRS